MSPGFTEDFDFNRHHERRKYDAHIVFTHRGRAYSGTIKNISLGGAFVVTLNVNLFSTGDFIAVSIPFTTGAKHVKRTGRIIWTNNEGFAIEFQ